MIPKFRAWDVHEKKMFTNAQLIIWNGNIYVNDNSKLNVDNLKGWNIDEKYLMQTTGLKDKNGNEIFEGDIVHAYSEGARLIGIIEYFDNAYCIKDKNGIYNSLWTNAEQYEIIGNIYDNPELMEEEECSTLLK